MTMVGTTAAMTPMTRTSELMSKRKTSKDELGRSFLHQPRTEFDRDVRQAQQALLVGDCYKAKAIVSMGSLPRPTSVRQEATVQRLKRAIKKCRGGLGNPNIIGGGSYTLFDAALLKAAARLTARDCAGAQAYAATVQANAKGRRQRKQAAQLAQEIRNCRRGS